MSPATHFLTGWMVANVVPLERRDRAIVTLACVVPDVDGLGIIPELLTRNSGHPLAWFSTFHHSLHTLPFAIVVAVFALILGRARWTTMALAMLSFHLHLLEDLAGSRGPDGFRWPIPYLSPLPNSWQLVWRGQWALNAWPNFALTLALLGATLYLAWWRGISPLEMFSARADASFLSAVRERFGTPTQA